MREGVKVKRLVTEEADTASSASFEFKLQRSRLRRVREREGRYLLRTNIGTAQPPEALWRFYIQLTEVEQAFKEIKNDLAVRPIYHQTEPRIGLAPLQDHRLLQQRGCIADALGHALSLAARGERTGLQAVHRTLVDDR